MQHALDCIVSMIPQDHVSLSEILPTCFDHEKHFFRAHEHDESQEVQVSDVDIDDASPEWRASLSYGDWVDALRVEKYSQSKEWLRAQIIEETETRFKLSFAGLSDYFNRYVSRDSNEIAPLLSRSSKQDQWKEVLKPGSLVDCLDTYSRWYNGTILDVRSNASGIVEFFVAFRVYTLNGDKQDDDGRLFTGWSSKYDEWIPKTSNRLAKFNTRASGAGVFVDEIPVDDSDDPSIDSIFAVYRGVNFGGHHLVQLINYFGQIGGFSAILDRICDKENVIPVNILQFLLDAISKMQPMLTKNFAKSYITNVTESVQELILGLPDAELRNLSIERLERIVMVIQFFPFFFLILSSHDCSPLVIKICLSLFPFFIFYFFSLFHFTS